MTQTNDQRQKSGALRSDQNSLIFDQGFSFSGYERDPLYLNLGSKKFLEVSGVSGMDSISDGRGAVFADFDNDGDLDVFLTTIQGQGHLLFRNNVGQDNNWLRVILEGGPGAGRDAFGAVVRVHTSAGTLTKVKDGGAGFVSQNDPRLLFGLGKDAGAEAIEVTWPNGQAERFAADASAGATLLLRQGSGQAQGITLARAQLPDPLAPSESFARGLKIAVGAAAPDVQLRAAGGSATSLRKQLQPGRRLLVNVWATWCLPCAKEMPELERLRPALAAHGIDLIGLNVDINAGANVSKFVQQMRVKYPIYLGGVAAIEQLYATDELSVPMSFVVDEAGTVTDLLPGWSAESRRRFLELAGGAPAKSSPSAGKTPGR